MNKNITADKYSIEFNDWHEAIDTALNGETSLSPHERKSMSTEDTKWFASKSLKHACDLALNGWTEGTERVKRISQPLIDRVTALVEKQDICFDVEGLVIDMGKYLDGEMECWQKLETEYSEGEGTKHVRLVFNGSVSACVNPETIIQRGVFICALIECLEFAGTRVEIIYTQAMISDRGVKTEFSIKLKSAEQPMDMARMVFALAHPSMLRRIGFSWCEQIENPKSHGFAKDDGYGHIGVHPQSATSDINISGLYAKIDPFKGDSELIQSILIETMEEQGIRFSRREK